MKKYVKRQNKNRNPGEFLQKSKMKIFFFNSRRIFGKRGRGGNSFSPTPLFLPAPPERFQKFFSK